MADDVGQPMSAASQRQRCGETTIKIAVTHRLLLVKVVLNVHVAFDGFCGELGGGDSA